MDGGDFGRRLQAARKNKGFRTQEALGDAVGVSGRMVRHYEAGRMPPPDVLARLRETLGDFDAAGDPVETAIRMSELDDWRQDTVVGFYKKHLQEQRQSRAG